jgi:hypothetical protein
MDEHPTDLLAEGLKANLQDKFRRGNVINLGAEGTLVAAGDIHGHRRNLERILGFADLEANPDRHLVLQEIIHGGERDADGGCLSYRLLFDVVRCKIGFPDRLHLIMGNHDTAFISGRPVMKDGQEMNRRLHRAIDSRFGGESEGIVEAMRGFLLSQPLAVRTANRMWFSHSLPSDNLLSQFDSGVLERPLDRRDCERPGSAYILTWGRRQSPHLLEEMAALLDVDVFVLGHQMAERGCKPAGGSAVIINSEQDHGCLLKIDLARSYTAEEVMRSTVQLASLT